MIFLPSSSKSVVRFLIASLLCLIFINIILILLYHHGHLNSRLGECIYKLFYVDRERNIPTFFNMLLLLLCASLAYYVFFQLRNNTRSYYWLGLSSLFLLLAFDEICTIHEHLSAMLPQYGLGGEGFLSFAWVIPYSILALFIGILSLRFLRSLPANIRNGFILGGFINIAGGIGVEMLGAKLYSNNNEVLGGLHFSILATLEEALEMAGLIVFIHYLLIYIATINTPKTQPAYKSKASL